MRLFSGALVLFLTACWMLLGQLASRNSSPAPTGSAPGVSTEKLTYDIEWRLIHAGTAVVEAEKKSARLKLQSAGMVSSLFKVEDLYSVSYDDGFCAASSLMDAQEGKRHHETRVTYDREHNYADFSERDLLKNVVIRSGGVSVPNCVHEIIGAMLRLRGVSIEPGQSTQVPMSDGRKSAAVKIEAQEREDVKLPTGTTHAVRYEAHLLNGVVYTRKGRLLMWLTDDARRLPVQIQVRMSFPIGTVTLHLSKEEHI